MFARTQPSALRPTGAAGAFEMITGTLRRRVEWHIELLAAICEFMIRLAPLFAASR